MYTDIDSGHVGMLNPRNECINKSRRPYKKIESTCFYILKATLIADHNNVSA